MIESRDLLRSLGYPGRDLYELPSSTKRFPDGAQYRVELPILSPVYIKFGLRNHPDVYPSGIHYESANISLCRERVHRAALGLAMIDRYYPEAVISSLGAVDLGIPASAKERN